MPDIVTLEAAKRAVIGKQVKALRREGKLPAVIYGAGIEPTAITIDMRSSTRILRMVTSATLVQINLEGEKYTTVLRERQYDRIKRELMHIDFLAVSMDVTMRASVPIRLVGLAPAIKEFDAMVLADSESLEVEALPSDLPEAIDVDVSGLAELGDTITAADLNLGEGVTILDNLNTVLAVAISGAALAEEEEEVEEELEEGAEPEVIERGKRDDEEDEEE